MTTSPPLQGFDWEAAIDQALTPRTDHSRRSIASWSESQPPSRTPSTSSRSEDGSGIRTSPIDRWTAPLEIEPDQVVCDHCGSPLSLIPVTRFITRCMVSASNSRKKRNATTAFDQPPTPSTPVQPNRSGSARDDLHAHSNSQPAHADDIGDIAAPSTSARPSKKARVSAKDQLEIMARELQEVRERLRTAEEQVKSAEERALRYRKYKQKYCQEKNERTSKLIPRPEGERGKNGWTLRRALRLEDHGDLYLTILASVREAIIAAGLDLRLTFHRQETSRLNDCYRLIKEQNSYLKRFDGDWPARELVISCLQNKRKTRTRKQRRKSRKIDGEGTDGGEQSGEESTSGEEEDEGSGNE